MSDYIVAQTHVDDVNHLLVFDSEGYYVVGDNQWKDITFTATLLYNGGNIGIAPRIYDTSMYMYLILHNETDVDTNTKTGFASLDTQITYDTLNLAQKKIDPLIVGEYYTFQVIIQRTNYKILLNGNTLFNIEYAYMPRGNVGIYSTSGNSCSDIEIQSSFADGWTTNIDSAPGAIVDIQELENDDKYLYLNNPTATELYAEQTLTVVGGTNYTLSFDYVGACTVNLIELNGAAPQTMSYIVSNQIDWTKDSITETFSSDCTSVNVRFSVVNQVLKVNNVQLEDKGFATDYIQNDSLTDAKVRANSIITYPSKDNINGNKGSISMWIKPAVAYDAASNINGILFEYGTSIRIYYSNGLLYFNGVSTATTLSADTWYNIVATWSQDELVLYLDGASSSIQGTFDYSGETATVIRIGNSSDAQYNIFNGTIDETIVYSSVLTQDGVNTAMASSTAIADNDSMILRATFNHAIGNFNKSIIETTLIPNYGSPVIVEKSNGDVMRKVSFFDVFTGEYRTFNEELIQYDKAYDYVTISYPSKDVDQNSFKISVVDADGVTYGTPYQLTGKRLQLTLTDDEKKTLHGKNLWVSYQLEDSYAVDFNIGVPDSFRVTLGKYDGKPVSVIYEGNRFTDEKLATMIELNPMLNPNHEGFLYITSNAEKVTSFRVLATPDNLPADGGSESLIIVEPLDMNGNFISQCKLDVTCEIGVIIPAYDENSIKLRDRAGRFLYRYFSPVKKLDDVHAIEVQDSINIVDIETGIGTQIPMTLTTLQTISAQTKSNLVMNASGQSQYVPGDTIEALAERYGSTVEDIAYTDDMISKVKTKYGNDIENDGSSSDIIIANARRYISEAVNEQIQVPINYSSSQIKKSIKEVEQNKMVAYLLDSVLDYMNALTKDMPSGLGDILDFNGDKKVSMDEVVWLTDNKYTAALTEKYNSLLTWKAANE